MTVPVHDPWNVVADPKLAFLAPALDPGTAERTLAQGIDLPAGELALSAIRVVRHKAGRRCLIAYDLEVHAAGKTTSLTLLGKVRAKGLDTATYHLQRALWQAGWHNKSSDGISTPEAVGIVPEWQMWLQRHVTGVPATKLLATPGGRELAGRIAEIAHKLHHATIPSTRQHTIDDELTILHDRLAAVAEQQPAWTPRLLRLLRACERLAATITPAAQQSIHRDFYADQVLVDADRLWLVDLDLYCFGDPGLDIGNFIAHITEWSLRVLGTPDALADCEARLEERFVALAGEALRPSIHAYCTFTLVRHIFLSTQWRERRAFTAALLDLCEQRLAPYVQV